MLQEVFYLLTWIDEYNFFVFFVVKWRRIEVIKVESIFIFKQLDSSSPRKIGKNYAYRIVERIDGTRDVLIWITILLKLSFNMNWKSLAQYLSKRLNSLLISKYWKSRFHFFGGKNCISLYILRNGVDFVIHLSIKNNREWRTKFT